MQSVTIECLCQKVKKSKRVHGFEVANVIKSKATGSRYTFMRAIINMSHGLVPSVISYKII